MPTLRGRTQKELEKEILEWQREHAAELALEQQLRDELNCVVDEIEEAKKKKEIQLKEKQGQEKQQLEQEKERQRKEQVF